MLKNKKNILLAVFVLTIVVLGICKLFPKANAQTPTSIQVTYSAGEGTGNNTTKTTSTDQDAKSMQLLDFGEDGTSSWEHEDIEGTYKDENGATQSANYTATFAGWKLKKINGTAVSEDYIYPDNDYIYFNDEPFTSQTITSVEFEALWGKTVYVRDKYNFNDIKNVYGYNVDGSTGDILTAKIYWDTSTVYGNNYNDGATKDTPVETIEKAYELLKNSNGGKVAIVNHITLEVSDAGQAYAPNFKNKSETRVYALGNNLNIPGVVTITGENLGSGTEVEGKANTNNTYKNSFMYIKNTRGAGTYNGKTYTSALVQLRFYTNVVLENFSCMGHRENYNSNKARQTGEVTFYNTANKRFVSENTFKGYKRSTSATQYGLDTGNWSNVKVGNYAALTSGMSGCTHIYGSSYSYTKDGKTYTVGSNDNIYLTLRGQNWYNIYAFYNSGTKSLNNLHINVSNLTCSYVYGVYNGTLTAKDMTINTYEVKTSAVAPTYNNTLNCGNVNVIMGGTSSNTITNFYGGGYSTLANGSMCTINSDLNYIVEGAKITNFYGGGNQVATLVTGDINIETRSGTITNLYGGGLGGYIGTEDKKSNINITVSGGTINYLYGGGSGGSVQLYTGNSTLDLSGYNRQGRYFYSGATTLYETTRATYTNSATKYDDTRVIVQDYVVKNGSSTVGTYNSVYVDIVYPEASDDNLVSCYRSYQEYVVSDAAVNGNITINLKNGAKISKDVYGGGKNGAVNGNIQINFENGAKVTGDLYGGGEGLQNTIATTINNIPFVWTGSTESHVLNRASFLAAAQEEGTTWKKAPAAGNYKEFLLASEVVSNFKQTDGKVYMYSSTMAKLGLIDGNTNIAITGGTAKNIYGGSNGEVASVSGDTTITMDSGTVTNIYGGGNAGEVKNTNITLTGGNISNNIYGGGKTANINGNSILNIANATITKNIYAGGYSGNIGENSETTITNTTATQVFGGGYAGDVLGNTSTKIISGTYTDIFGGGDQGHIGKDGVENTGAITLTIGDETDEGVTVSGIAYGGGKGKVEEGEQDARNFPTAYGTASVIVQGVNTYVENYGSKTLGKVVGDVDVTFKDYWTGNGTAKYKTMNGIDRATTVSFENSYVLLTNTDGSGISAIENLVIPSGSGIKISAAENNISGDFTGGGEIYFDSEGSLTVQGNITGKTTMILNPKLTQDKNMIKGGIENAYIKVAGNTPQEQAVVSGETNKYVILQDNDGEYECFYIEKDIEITSSINPTSISIPGRKYTGEIQTNENAKILNNGVFSTNINISYEVQSENGQNKYENVTRQFAIKTDKTTYTTIPKGTEILMTNGGNKYTYILQESKNKIALSNFKDNNGKSFTGITNFDTDANVTRETNQVTGVTTYKLNEQFRFIVNFANSETKIANGKSYYPMIDILDDGTWLSEEQTDSASNTVQISSREYSLNLNLDKEEFTNDGIITERGTLNVSANSDVSTGNNTDLYLKVYLKNSSGNVVKIPDGAIIKVNDSDITDSTGLIKITDNITNKAVSQNINISLDMSNILKQYMFATDSYKLVSEIIVSENEILKQNAETKLEKQFAIIDERNTNFGLNTEIVLGDKQKDNAQLVENTSAEQRTVKLSTDVVNISGAQIKMKLLERTGQFKYEETSNSKKISATVNGTATQNIEVNFAKSMKLGTYRVVFELYNENNKKLTETFVNFIVIDKIKK